MMPTAPTMDAPQLVAAIVLNWNLPDDTIRCVESLLASTHPRLEIIVVDNGSTDDSVTRLRGRFGTEIEVLETGENLYFAGGANKGISRGLELGADWLLVLNNDTIADTGLITALLEEARGLGDPAILAPVIYYLDCPRTVWDAGSVWPWWSPLPVPLQVPDSARKVTLCTGCAMLIRADAAQWLGGYDSAYTMYYEDADFCMRAREAGYTVAIVPNAHLWHAVSRSADRRPTLSLLQHTRFRMRFYRQHTPRCWRPLTLAIVMTQTLLRAAWDWLCGARDMASAQWDGLVSGLRESL